MTRVTSMNIGAYFDRIGYRGRSEPSYQVLRDIHRAHLLSIPYENLDIHLGHPLELEPAAIFEKLVLRKRGGWCYEMNGLLAWALGELGFEVRLLSGAVGRDRHGQEAEGTHLVLLVEAGGQYLADVGFGDGFLEPLPLYEGEYQQGFLRFRLSRGGGRWTLHNHPQGGASSFDFDLRPHRLSDFAAQCQRQQTSPDSGFVQKTVCQRMLPEGILTLRGAVLKSLWADKNEQRVIESEAEYRRVLEEHFGLQVDTARLWPRVWQRHLEWQNQPEV